MCISLTIGTVAVISAVCKITISGIVCLSRLPLRLASSRLRPLAVSDLFGHPALWPYFVIGMLRFWSSPRLSVRYEQRPHSIRFRPGLIFAPA